MASRNPRGLCLLLPLIFVLLCAVYPGCQKRPANHERGADGAPAPVRSTAAYEPCARMGARRDAHATLRWGKLQLVARDEVLEPATKEKPPARLVLAALADTKEALPATVDQMGRLAKRLRAMSASAVLVLGGVDQTFEGIRTLLQSLRGLPVIGLPGDRESLSGWQAAMDGLQPRGADLTRVRAVVLPGVSMVGVPGYYLGHHLLAKEQGCSYSREDLRALGQLARRLPQPRLLLAHGPPRGEGRAAVDRAFGDVNIGDPLLADLLRDSDIRFGIFAHVHEAAGHATTRDGKTVSEGVWSDELLLNVGSADSVPHEDLEGRWSRGTAVLLEIASSRARFKMLRLDNNTAARPN